MILKGIYTKKNIGQKPVKLFTKSYFLNAKIIIFLEPSIDIIFEKQFG